MRALPYSEGTWFAIPLKSSRYAVGCVARASTRGKIILAYLFDRCSDKLPTLADVENLLPEEAKKVIRIGDLFLINGHWPLIGKLGSWQRDAWFMPHFIRKEEVSKRAWVSIYSDADPRKLVKEEPTTWETLNLERDAVYGSGAVEKVVERLCLNTKGPEN